MSSRRQATYHVVKKTNYLSCRQEDEPPIMSSRRQATYHVVKKTNHLSCRQEDEPPIMSSRRRANYHVMKTSQLSCRKKQEPTLTVQNKEIPLESDFRCEQSCSSIPVAVTTVGPSNIRISGAGMRTIQCLQTTLCLYIYQGTSQKKYYSSK
ncbi:hypothetical protein LSH36_530g02010 [Paralvinella palmiformis]|uniref:Uncharacterized protein n=1 Tax=Paralvinella palmiformis TaxID=53620 RepID=A0AAD9MWC9_9ANNE|nr:hypothetical protein LSH36_530g02010 [Paralvinella palmiformis]